MWQFSAWAYELDQWLKAHLGRPYTIILASSLGAGIAAAGANLGQLFSKPVTPSIASVATLLGAGLVQVALLINQLAQLHEYRQFARERRAARREARAARKAARGGDPK
jgi:hypothetical protein